eukprot:3954459-Amphidinium_carterae.1
MLARKGRVERRRGDEIELSGVSRDVAVQVPVPATSVIDVYEDVNCDGVCGVERKLDVVRDVSDDLCRADIIHEDAGSKARANHFIAGQRFVRFVWCSTDYDVAIPSSTNEKKTKWLEISNYRSNNNH